MLMLDNALPVIMGWAIFESIYPKFYHANVRLNFGPLRYFFVTPQSHRLHHAVDPAYRDVNFGFTFCVWDRIFDMQCHDHQIYPFRKVYKPQPH
jgi:sterol desaturase/sphingolipid hydroxylase (fatty acid hydroxylase superfamily)